MKKRKLLLITVLSSLFSIGSSHAQLALDLAGIDNYTETNYNLAMGGFTIEYDMYMHTLQNFNGGVTFTCGNSPSPIDFYVDQNGIITSFTGNCSAFHSMNPTNALAAGQWYNIAYVYVGGPAGFDLYIDGVLIGTHIGFGYNPAFSNGKFRIGSRMDDATNANAKFDNVRIWSIPRSNTEIIEDMTACFSGNEPGLDILYKMEEGSGSTLIDLATANGSQDATIFGPVSWTNGKANPIIEGAMFNISACDSYDSPSGNYTWNTSGTYNDTIPSSTLGCDSVLTINLLINSVTNAPSISEDVLCAGDTTLLNANSTVVSEFYIGDPNTMELNDNETYPCVYGNYYEGAKHQILVLASELSAMGMNAGEITGMEFYVENMNGLTDPLLGLTIKMAHTLVDELDYTFETPAFTTTYSSASLPISVGAMTHDFSTPFMWDGTSNVLFEICYNNEILDYTENPSMYYTPTTFISTSYYEDDSEPALCGETDANDISTNRPNFKLFGSSTTTLWSNVTGGIINPNNAITQAVPTADGTYTLEVSNSLSGCADNGDQLNVTVNANPTVDLGTDISQPNPPVTLDAGSGFTTYDWSTGETSQTIDVTNGGEYYVTVTNAANCSATDTIQVNFTAGIENVDGSLAHINFYPNPANDYLNVDVEGFKDEVLRIEIVDMNGKSLQSFDLNNSADQFTTQLDLSSIKDGVYLVQISTSNASYAHRIVIQK